MNKREQAEMESLRNQLRIAKAMRFTEPVETDVPKPTSCSDAMTKGWMFHWFGGRWRVERACSTSIYHGVGDDSKTTTQEGMDLYSARVLALRACRHHAEQECAKWLAELDAEIEAEVLAMAKGDKP